MQFRIFFWAMNYLEDKPVISVDDTDFDITNVLSTVLPFEKHLPVWIIADPVQTCY